MSFGAVRVGDMVISYNPFLLSGPFITGSHDVFHDMRPAVRLGDLAAPGPAITGSHNVFINMMPAVRFIDQVANGIITEASITTFIW